MSLLIAINTEKSRLINRRAANERAKNTGNKNKSWILDLIYRIQVPEASIAEPWNICLRKLLCICSSFQDSARGVKLPSGVSPLKLDLSRLKKIRVPCFRLLNKLCLPPRFFCNYFHAKTKWPLQPLVSPFSRIQHPFHPFSLLNVTLLNHARVSYRWHCKDTVYDRVNEKSVRFDAGGCRLRPRIDKSEGEGARCGGDGDLTRSSVLCVLKPLYLIVCTIFIGGGGKCREGVGVRKKILIIQNFGVAK